MRIVLLLLIILVSFSSTSQTVTAPTSDSTFRLGFDYKRDFRATVERTRDKNSDIYYHKLLPRFLSLDSGISREQTLALMIGYTQDPHYKPFEDMEKEKEIFDLNDSSDYEGSLELSQTYLKTHPFSLRGLKERSYSYHQLKVRDSAKYFMDLVDRVMNAMIYSGKGKLPENPIFSLGLADGEYFIPNVGLSITKKNTEWNRNNHFVEVIDAMNEAGEYKKYYFVIQHAKDKIDDDLVNEAKAKKAKKKAVTPPKKRKGKGKEKEAEKKEGAENTPAEVPIDAPAMSDSTGVPLPISDSTIIK